jgi:cytochrome c556
MYRLFGLVGMMTMVLALSAAQAQDKGKAKDIADVMKKAHKGATAFKAVTKKEIDAKEFDKAKDTMTAWVAISSQLSEFEPPKGTKESWKTQTEKYAKDVKALAKAVGDKDAEAAEKAWSVVDKGCGACHSKHKAK